jgi:hypothetical protein
MATHGKGSVLPTVGVVTAAATALVGLTPTVVAAGGDSGGDANSITDVRFATAGTGEFEPCSAYFGFGKVDLVEFDVEVDGEGPAPSPTVENGGVSVVLEIETEGGTITCVPEEVTEQEWDDEYEGAPFDLPAYPGPGHYIYPAVNTLPEIEGFGLVTGVGFRVTDVAEGYTLVAPTDVDPLAAVTASLFDEDNLDQRVFDIVAADAGAAAESAFSSAIDGCIEDDGFEPAQSADLDAALQALIDYLGVGVSVPEPVTCSDIGELYLFTSLAASVEATTLNAEVIQLAVPTTTTTTAAPTTTAATQAAAATPRFTG